MGTKELHKHEVLCFYLCSTYFSGAALEVQMDDLQHDFVNSLYRLSMTTGTGSDCGMNNGGIFLSLDGMTHEHCETPILNNPGDDFRPGYTDVYSGDYLGQCGNTDFPNGVFQFTVHHEG